MSFPPPPTPLQSQPNVQAYSMQTNTATNGGNSAVTKSDPDGGGSSEEDIKLASEASEVAQVRKRRRMVNGFSSCETCKQRKVKCDRMQPSCGWCERNGQECIYRQKKKPGLRAGIGRELEERLNRVEDVLASHSRLLGSHMQSSSVITVTQFPSPSTASHSHLSPPMSHQGSIAAGTSPQHHVQPTPSLITPIPPIERASHEPKRETPNLSTSRSFDPDLPTDDIMCAMIELFFVNIHPTCPILHQKTVLSSFFGRPSSDVDPADIILMHAIVSAALRFSTDQRVDKAWKDHFRELTKRKVVFYALENPSVQSLRAVVIIVLDVVASTNGPSGWGLLAMTTRMALHLGLAKEPAREVDTQISTMGVGTLPECKDWIEEEGRRRLFWMIFTMDVVTTLGTSLDLTMDEMEIERQLPCRDPLWDQNQPIVTRWFRPPKRSTPDQQSVNNVESLSAFSHQVEVVGILGRIHRFLRQRVDINVHSEVEVWQLNYRNLDRALTDFEKSLPALYGSLTRVLDITGTIGGTPVDPALIMLHATYNTSVIRLHSSAAYPTTRSDFFSPSYQASQRCLSAVDNIKALTRLVLSNSMLPLLGSSFAFTTWVAARLLLVHASTRETGLIPDVGVFLKALREGGKWWQTAERYATIIQRVLDELLHQPPPSSPGSTPAVAGGKTCVGILADMRMTAFAVDVMISRQPEHRPQIQQHQQQHQNQQELGGGMDYVQQQQSLQMHGMNEQNAPYLSDLFGFFNFPRVAGDAGINTGWSTGEADQDWLNFSI